MNNLTGEPHPKKWSIAACMQHLLIVNSYYHPQLQKKIIDTQALTSQFTIPLINPSWMGRFFMRFVNPDKFRKTSAPGFSQTCQELRLSS